jgi:hypothetical protein
MNGKLSELVATFEEARLGLSEVHAATNDAQDIAFIESFGDATSQLGVDGGTSPANHRAYEVFQEVAASNRILLDAYADADQALKAYASEADGRTAELIGGYLAKQLTSQELLARV